ncbi:hypothetical protein [Spirosoma spitsbergense]|uniref:hypothetical protein n=1 Tax=Spirosoma spitsbergense TaxID=431554 RepID=UPI00035D937B|nr:hypothetical protein [Spirosoma spitsbergense]
MMKASEQENKGIYTAISNPSTVITDWSQAVTSFHELFRLLVEAIDTIERQSSYAFYANRKLQLHKLKKSRVESIQVLEQLLVDMDGVCSFDQVLPQASIDRLYSHTIRLQKQNERIQIVLGLNKFQAIYTSSNSITAWA